MKAASLIYTSITPLSFSHSTLLQTHHSGPWDSHVHLLSGQGGMLLACSAILHLISLEQNLSQIGIMDQVTQSRSYLEYSCDGGFSTLESYSCSSVIRLANGTPQPSLSFDHSPESEEDLISGTTPSSSTWYETASSPLIMLFASPSIPLLYETAIVCPTDSEAIKSISSEDFITAKASMKADSVSNYITPQQWVYLPQSSLCHPYLLLQSSSRHSCLHHAHFYSCCHQPQHQADQFYHRHCHKSHSCTFCSHPFQHPLTLR